MVCFAKGGATSSETFLNKAQAKNWFSKAWDWIAQPFQPVWGWYEEGNNKIYAPYTTFVNVYDGTKRNKIITNIQVANDSFNYKKLYKSIYLNALTSSSGACKNAAFVYLIGLNDTGGVLNDVQRNVFRDRAIHILKELNTSSNRFSYFDNQILRGFELVQYLQAHDYLMYGARLYGYNYGDRGLVEDQLHEYTYELYSSSNNFFCWDGTAGALRRYNNLAIIVSGAIGMAAIVLNGLAPVPFLINIMESLIFPEATITRLAATSL